MRLAVALVLGLVSLHAQTCVPAALAPTGRVSGTLDESACLLSDTTRYHAYRIDLPVRGAIRIDLASSDAGLILRDAAGARLNAGSAIHRPLEAGTYALLVHASAPAASTAYSVQTAFTAEPGMLCAGPFPRTGLNQAVSGALGSSACALPDGTPYEAYSLSTFGAGTVTVSVSSSAFSPLMILRDSAGYAIAYGTDQISAPLDAGEDYRIVVATSDRTGAYQLSTTFQPADDEVCRQRWAFSESGADDATISGDSCTIAAAGEDPAWYNFYRLSVTIPGLAELTVNSRDFGATLQLLDESGNLLAVDTGVLRLHLRPGNYTARVLSSGPSGGAYRFDYRFTPGPPQPCPTSSLQPGNPATGTLSPATCRGALGVSDRYAVALTGPGTLELNLASTGFEGVLALRDERDNVLVLDRDFSVAHFRADLTAGFYTVETGAAAGAGTYQLTSAFTAHDLAPCNFAQPLSIDGGYIQKLGAGSCRGPNGLPLDVYSFTLPADGVVAAFFTSSEVDGFLTLAGSTGSDLRADDNSYGAPDSMLVQYLPAGDYLVYARAAGNTSGGYYEIDLRSVLGPRPPFCATRGRLSPGTPVSGTLTIASCQYPGGTFADLYALDLAADATVDLRLSSPAFDAFLVLLDAKGNVIDQDDDSGGDTDARINRELAAGSYFVAVRPASGYSHVGAYTLTLSP